MLITYENNSLLSYIYVYRFIHHLEKNVYNKARVDSSICNAYLVEEASNFCSYYFESHVHKDSGMCLVMMMAGLRFQ